MAGIFYNLGRMIGPKVRKGKWIWHSLTSSPAQAIQTEYEMGRDLAGQITQQVGLDPDDQDVQLLNEIGANLTRRLVNKQRKFNFNIIKGDQPNAMALPGGFIFVTRSLFDLCARDPDELAFVLAHEMGHVVRGHALDRVVNNIALSTASQAAPIRSVMGAFIRKVGIDFLENAYSQDRELQTDIFGIRLAAAAGYNPQAAQQLLQRLAEKSQTIREHSLLGYFSTHPSFSDRVKNMATVLKSLT